MTETPVPKEPARPVYALVKIGDRKVKCRILWSEYDSRHPDTFVVLHPGRDQKIQTRRDRMVFLP